ncbi:rhodanese-like domain-containing protein [Aeromonas cavernicola]|uniref:Sulfurtransferase n=1 Tax=Aeromonas cavernicola TaxID=1006623 RepID=A0A2H9U3K7_9GAMM|nr:rhodanese-like domain-containing protein [Aeromonas cavernicola]PJG58605.1 sulfurtransferase [Aeromonas cavernicola]
MKRYLRWLPMALAAVLLWPTLSAVAGELPPLSLTEAKAKQAVIVDTRASYFYQGWPMEGEQQGGHVAGAEHLSAEWKYRAEQWPAALKEKGLHAKRPVALYGAPREVAEVARLLRLQGIKQLFELQGWQSAPREALARWQQLVHPRWLADLQAGKPVTAAPQGDWKLFEVDWGSPKAFLISHIPGAGYIDTNRLETEVLWNKVSDQALEAFLLENGIRHDTTVILYGRNTMAAARAAHLMLYAGVNDVRLLDGGLDAWFIQHQRTETGLPKQYKPVPAFGVTIPARPEFYTTLDQAKSLLQQPDGALVSIRTWDEFVGNTSGYSYIKPKGDIPGAKWGHGGVDANSMSDFHNPDGTMKPAREILTMWDQWHIEPTQQTAFYCGTGWRASEAFFYAWLMDWQRISVYDGGWYEWSMDPNNPIVTGERQPSH